MPSRLSASAALAVAALAIFTGWITWRAKAMERNLGVDALKAEIVGRPAPPFRLPAVDGRTVSLADYRGRKLAVIFWASWNNGSHPAMFALSMFYDRTHTAASDFDVVAISVDDKRADAQKFVTENKTPFPVLVDSSQSVADAYHVRTIPAVVVIDPAGKVTFGRVGFDQRLTLDLARELGIAGYRGMEFGGPDGGRRN